MTVKALALFSGGLDSTLAIKIVQEAGVAVAALHFSGPFSCGEPEGGLSRVERLAGSLGVELIVERLGQDFLDMVVSPRFGYGSGMNPCIDCRIHELKRAARLMDRVGASFLVTGEVVGQRPMSQKLPTLRMIEREAGVEGLVVRPLSAHNLPETIPEQRGWIDRSLLLGIKGRSRRIQFDLAARYGIAGYSAPAGGCLLTMKEFSRRLEDLLDHDGKLNEREVDLLRVGRLFRIGPGTRLIVGRNRVENERIAELATDGDAVVRTTAIPGPTALVIGLIDRRMLKTAAAAVVRYSDAAADERAEVSVEHKPGPVDTMWCTAASHDDLERLRI